MALYEIDKAGFPHTRGGGPLILLSLVRWSYVFPTRVGGGPLTVAAKSGVTVFSPHAWGWTGRRGKLTRRLLVFPTRVGVDRLIII